MKNTYKLSKKAWGINWNRIMEGDYYRGNIDPVYAETLGKAKSQLLKEASDYSLKYGEEITFLNIPVIRCKRGDKFIFEEKELRINEIEDILRKREKEKEFDIILNNTEITHCFIMKGGAYYCNNYCGYTEFYFNAGVYTKKQAVSEAIRCDEINIIPIDIIEHNKKINQKIEDLKLKLL